MFPFEAKCNSRLKGGFQEVFFHVMKSPKKTKNGDNRAQNGDSFQGVVSKRPITGCNSKRGICRFDKKGPYESC